MTGYYGAVRFPEHASSPVCFLRFEAGDVLGLGERQQIALLGRVQEVRGVDDPVAGSAAYGDGTDLVTVRTRPRRAVFEQDGQPAGAYVRRQHGLQARRARPVARGSGGRRSLPRD